MPRHVVVCVRISVTLCHYYLKYLFSICVNIFVCVSLCVLLVCRCPRRPRGVRQPWNFSDVVVNHLLKRVGVNPGPLQEQETLLSTEPSSHGVVLDYYFEPLNFGTNLLGRLLETEDALVTTGAALYPFLIYSCFPPDYILSSTRVSAIIINFRMVFHVSTTSLEVAV